jgi:hypothetical protein
LERLGGAPPLCVERLELRLIEGRIVEGTFRFVEGESRERARCVVSSRSDAVPWWF